MKDNIQTILIPNERSKQWQLEWLGKYDLNPLYKPLPDITNNYTRYRQFEPQSKGQQYISTKRADGVIIVREF